MLAAGYSQIHVAMLAIAEKIDCGITKANPIL